MRTIAESIDALMEGDVLRAGDLLVQRFKALETSVIDGTWARACHHELIPEEGVGLASGEERQAISRLELQRRKLAEAVSRKWGVGSAAPAWPELEKRRVSREDEALASPSAEISELSREKQKLVKLRRTKKRYKQARAARRKVEGPEVEVREAVPVKCLAEKVVLKPGPGGRPWKK